MGRPLSVVLLAAGYGTRLYPLTQDTPKALLPVGDGVVADWIMRAVEGVAERSRVVLVTNRRFLPQFEAWRRRGNRPVALVEDGTSAPEARLGAIEDLRLALAEIPEQEDVLVLGTDNLFTWPLGDFVAFAEAKRPDASVAFREVETLEEAARCAVASLDPQGRIVRFVEKPVRPASRLASLCVYLFPAPVRARVVEFLATGGGGDAPGLFIEWLVAREPVYGFVTAGDWFDIGSSESYQRAVEHFSALQKREG